MSNDISTSNATASQTSYVPYNIHFDDLDSSSTTNKNEMFSEWDEKKDGKNPQSKAPVNHREKAVQLDASLRNLNTFGNAAEEMLRARGIQFTQVAKGREDTIVDNYFNNMEARLAPCKNTSIMFQEPPKQKKVSATLQFGMDTVSVVAWPFHKINEGVTIACSTDTLHSTCEAVGNGVSAVINAIPEPIRKTTVEVINKASDATVAVLLDNNVSQNRADEFVYDTKAILSWAVPAGAAAGTLKLCKIAHKSALAIPFDIMEETPALKHICSAPPVKLPKAPSTDIVVAPVAVAAPHRVGLPTLQEVLNEPSTYAASLLNRVGSTPLSEQTLISQSMSKQIHSLVSVTAINYPRATTHALSTKIDITPTSFGKVLSDGIVEAQKLKATNLAVEGAITAPTANLLSMDRIARAFDKNCETTFYLNKELVSGVPATHVEFRLKAQTPESQAAGSSSVVFDRPQAFQPTIINVYENTTNPVVRTLVKGLLDTTGFSHGILVEGVQNFPLRSIATATSRNAFTKSVDSMNIWGNLSEKGVLEAMVTKSAKNAETSGSTHFIIEGLFTDAAEVFETFEKVSKKYPGATVTAGPTVELVPGVPAKEMCFEVRFLKD